MSKIAIHGFGRIGRATLKAALRHQLFTPAAISDFRDLPTLAALFAYDSNYGAWPEAVKTSNNVLLIGEHKIAYYDTTQNLPDWHALGVEVVIDCMERAPSRVVSEAHLRRGARKVLSAAIKNLSDCDALLIPGVNLDAYEPQNHHIVSTASPTTCALAPLIFVLKENFGIKSGFFATIHAYTGSQSLTDEPMKNRRSSWAATENIIPAASEAARALKFIWPNLLITGKAYRVPIRTGSIVELTVWLEQPTNAAQVKKVLREAALKPPLKGVLGVLEEEYASSRIVGEPLSLLIDLPLLQVESRNLLSIAAWYDNETGYATRLAETALFLAKCQSKNGLVNDARELPGM